MHTKLFFKQQDKFIDLPQVIGFKAHKQRKYNSSNSLIKTIPMFCQIN